MKDESKLLQPSVDVPGPGKARSFWRAMDEEEEEGSHSSLILPPLSLAFQAASQETCSPITFSSHCDGQEKLR
jgi:hypothetical protein